MFVALRDLRFARGRFALMGGVVALITLLVVLLSGLTAGLARGNTSAVTDLPADRLVLAAPPPGEKPAFSESSIPPSVQHAWVVEPGIRRADPVAVGMSRASRGERTAGVAVFAVAPGSPLAPAVDDGRVVLSVKAAAALSVSAGDELQLGGRHVVVAAVEGTGEYSHAPLVWASTADASPNGQAPRAATFLALVTDPGTDPGADAGTGAGVDDDALAAADARLGTLTLSKADSLAAIGSYSSENGSLQLMRALLFAISALVIGAFFTVWTVQRSGEIAILKAVGASTANLLRDALGQALVLLVAGTALGTAAAAAIGAAVGGAVPVVLDAATLAVPALTLIALGLAGAAVALRAITSVDPLTALGSAR
ncbi:ABC transporter substrate-binding protein [Intrasporangium oryzae NRRL B-24470]|uniref:ABC transporter substrate-binding protein n=1 Tax=Intrasporangium oryzae NRRL B-24470 TaxID=1386089 RepID=W9G9I3_9MICO|nr:ABC transporter permease [Intrasporangium oryzae]EWT02725.1 ABC transporter substrate-binding protein [Intrasporangium oryzae NRRL B-24470]